MGTSIFLARVMGIYLITVSFFLIVQRKNLKQLNRDLSEHVGLMVFAGAITYILGLLVVLSHNIWTNDWKVIVTILGWLTLLKGLVRLIAPKWVASIGIKVITSSWTGVWFIITIGLGLYLTYVGF